MKIYNGDTEVPVKDWFKLDPAGHYTIDFGTAQNVNGGFLMEYFALAKREGRNLHDVFHYFSVGVAATAQSSGK